jgi:hypothetical protein
LAFDYNRRDCDRATLQLHSEGRHMLRIKLACLSSVCALLIVASSAHAYDLSRQYPADSEKTERGFVNLQAALWLPALGSFSTYHQPSLDFGAEVGFRFLSLRGQHNFYVVGGLGLSPQKLDPDQVGTLHRDSTMLLGYAGVRYIPSVVCTGDGSGCLFFELRLGLAFESAEDDSGHRGPNGDLTLLPGVGYRFRLGDVFQLGARADISYTAESGSRELGWVTLGAFLGFGW